MLLKVRFISHFNICDLNKENYRMSSVVVVIIEHLNFADSIRDFFGEVTLKRLSSFERKRKPETLLTNLQYWEFQRDSVILF